MATGLGDEGGFAPDIATPEEALELLVSAIDDAGYTAGRRGVAIALDPAASEFADDGGGYRVGGEPLTSAEMIERYVAIVDRFPVWSIEDGLAEGDRPGWIALTERLGGQVQLVGDDNFVTNPAIIADAIDAGIANAALIKVNQIGTITETLDAMGICRAAGYAQMVSHRSGETPDPLHRRSRRSNRMRTAQVRRTSAGRTGRQVQPAACHRSRSTRPSLWSGLTVPQRVQECPGFRARHFEWPWRLPAASTGDTTVLGSHRRTATPFTPRLAGRLHARKQAVRRHRGSGRGCRRLGSSAPDDPRHRRDRRAGESNV